MWPLTRAGSDRRPMIRVSDLVTAASCPLRFYHLQGQGRPTSPRYVIAKEIARHHGGGDPDLLWDGVEAVMPEIEPAMRGFLEASLLACERMIWPPFTEQDLQVSSARHRIAGTVDLAGGPHGLWGVVRSSSAPVEGIYAADRVRVAAYALCLEEIYHMPVREGLVIYIPDGVVRTCPVSPRDRRTVLAGRDAAEMVISGAVPKRPLNPPCTHCPVADRCRQGASSRF
jgi:CRISPR-associated exonuclease Cas4